MATFVLVHGGWHGGWCWKKVVPLLRAMGHLVYTPTLTGLGERAHLRSKNVSMAIQIQDIVGMIEYEDLEDVILVGHSYGGLVVAGVSGRIPQHLSHIVFLDAIVPENGQSFKDIYPDYFQYLKKVSDLQGDGWLIPIPDGNFGVSDPEDLTWMRSKLTPGNALSALEEPIVLTNPKALDLPRTYILCNENGVESDFAKFAASAPIKGWRVRELVTGHDAMITAPEELTSILLGLC